MSNTRHAFTVMYDQIDNLAAAVKDADAEIVTLKSQRSELLAALRDILDLADTGYIAQMRDIAVVRSLAAARAAIANVEGN